MEPLLNAVLCKHVLTRRGLHRGGILALMAGGCGPGEIFVTRTGEMKARVIASDNRSGIPCDVTHTSYGAEDLEPITKVLTGQEATRAVTFGTQLRMPVPFKPKVALVARCQGYEKAVSPEVEIEIGWLKTPQTDVGTIVVQPRQLSSGASPRRQE